MNRTLNRETVIELTRAAVLAALDQTAMQLFAGSPLLGMDAGATDADLPALFPAIDAHAERLAERFGFTLEA